MKRTFLLLALLAPVMLTGCDELMFNGPDDVFLRVDEAQYEAGDTVSLMLINDSNETIGYNLCAHLIQQSDDDGWTDTLYGEDGPCFAIWYQLRPGRSDTYPTQLDSLMPPGTYRFRTRVDSESEGEFRVYSPSFEVE